MLVRSLGWVRLPAEKESMVAEVTRALDTLGVNFSVVRQAALDRDAICGFCGSYESLTTTRLLIAEESSQMSCGSVMASRKSRMTHLKARMGLRQRVS